MKIESPLDVLSRAASIVQGEDKPMLESGIAIVFWYGIIIASCIFVLQHAEILFSILGRTGSCTDSGFEDDLVQKSPRSAISPQTLPSTDSEKTTNEVNNKSHSPKRSLPSLNNSISKKVKLEESKATTMENTIEISLQKE